MSGDIVERLRARYVHPHFYDSIFNDAAAEITNLRAANAALKQMVSDKDGLLTALRAERDDFKDDYLRRHQDACDYWLVLKRIADGYGPDHLSKACRDWAQFAIDEANRRPTAVIATERGGS